MMLVRNFVVAAEGCDKVRRTFVSKQLKKAGLLRTPIAACGSDCR